MSTHETTIHEVIRVEAIITRADGTKHDLGLIAYDHPNPLRRLAWRFVGKPRANRRIAKANAAGTAQE